ncbi:unnamed protein product [Amoebophrya sp. A120]|nr:unnamed protein product [Amoebophrya sp. A120]|eukprot:GSA120T00011620001.1
MLSLNQSPSARDQRQELLRPQAPSGGGLTGVPFPRKRSASPVLQQSAASSAEKTYIRMPPNPVPFGVVPPEPGPGSVPEDQQQALQQDRERRRLEEARAEPQVPWYSPDSRKMRWCRKACRKVERCVCCTRGRSRALAFHQYVCVAILVVAFVIGTLSVLGYAPEHQTEVLRAIQSVAHLLDPQELEDARTFAKTLAEAEIRAGDDLNKEVDNFSTVQLFASTRAAAKVQELRKLLKMSKGEIRINAGTEAAASPTSTSVVDAVASAPGAGVSTTHGRRNNSSGQDSFCRKLRSARLSEELLNAIDEHDIGTEGALFTAIRDWEFGDRDGNTRSSTQSSQSKSGPLVVPRPSSTDHEGDRGKQDAYDTPCRESQCARHSHWGGRKRSPKRTVRTQENQRRNSAFAADSFVPDQEIVALQQGRTGPLASKVDDDEMLSSGGNIMSSAIEFANTAPSSTGTATETTETASRGNNINFSSVRVSDLRSLIFLVKSFVISETLDFFDEVSSRPNTEPEDVHHELMVRRLCLRDVTAVNADKDQESSTLSGFSATTTRNTWEKVKGKRTDGEVSHQLFLVEPLFRFLLGLLLIDEVKRTFLEPADIAVIWKTFGFLDHTETEEAHLLVEEKLKKLYGQGRFGFASSLWDLWRFSLGNRSWQRSKERQLSVTPEIPTALNRGLSLYYTRLNAMTVHVRDQILRLEFLARGPSEKHFLIERMQNVTEHGLNGVRHICDFPGSLVLPYHNRDGGALRKAESSILSAPGDPHSMKYTTDLNTRLHCGMDDNIGNIELSAAHEENKDVEVTTWSHTFPLVEPPAAVRRLLGKRGEAPTHTIEAADGHHRHRRFLWVARNSYLQWILSVAQLSLDLFLPVGVPIPATSTPSNGGLHLPASGAALLVEKVLTAITNVFEKRRSLFSQLDALLVYLALGVRALHLFGKKFHFVHLLGKEALKRAIARETSLNRFVFKSYASCLQNRIRSVETAQKLLATEANCSTPDGHLASALQGSSKVSPERTRHKGTTTSKLEIDLWADDAYSIPLPDCRYSLDALDSVLVNVYRTIYLQQEKDEEKRTGRMSNIKSGQGAGPNHSPAQPQPHFYPSIFNCEKINALSRSTSASPSPYAKFFVDIGIGRLAGDYQTRYLQAFENWDGRMIDMIGSLSRIDYSAAKVTPENILDLLKSKSVPTKFELFSLHIDGYDWHVLRRLLLAKWFQPRVLLIQTSNGYFYPDRYRVPIGLSLIPKYERPTRTAVTNAQQKHSEVYEREHGHHKAYSASARGLQLLGNAFGYKLVYFGWLSVVIVQEEYAKDFEHVDDLFRLCEEYVLSPRGRERAWPSSQHLCHETELMGLSDEELEDLYYVGDLALSAEQIRDSKFSL